VDGAIAVTKLIVLLGWAKSNNEARRAIEGGGVNVGPDKAKIADPKASVQITDGLIVRLGSRKIARFYVCQ
jgi:tyrosyl-tRNA synthetase